MSRLFALLFPLVAGLGRPVTAQEEGAPPPAQEEAAPAPRKRAAKPAAAETPESVKPRLVDIAKVHKNQLAFGGDNFEAWKAFWTKLRDERGHFEVRLAKQREAFIESLHSLDPKDRGQGLVDFETMQGNVMRSFEQEQANKIKDFISDMQGRLREFGAAQETERVRLAQASEDAWAQMKASLGIQAPPPPDKSSKDKSKKKADKKKDKDKKKESDHW